MNKKRKILSGCELAKLSSSGLERQANIMLYGHSDLRSPGTDGQVIELFRRVIYTPSDAPLDYECPLTAYQTFEISHCSKCGRPRSYFGADLCRECYRLKARERFETKTIEIEARIKEEKDGAAWLESQRNGGFEEDGMECGIAMPKTEWWDDTDYTPYSNPINKGRSTRLKWDTKE